MGEILALCLKGQTRVGVSMYHATTSAEAKHAMIKSAVEVSRSKRDNILFNKILKAIKPIRDRRNDFAHHLWGTSSSISDGLLLIDPRDELAYSIAWHHTARTGRWPKALMSTFGGYDLSKIYVYRKNDLERELKNALDGLYCVGLFRNFLTQKGSERAETRKTLIDQPLLKRVGRIQPR
ncbi:MAG: hypothetical protein IIA34_08305 [Proteobacteria bacterium]|nr:hypothetical protein [Pseudomonadota bacterium]